VRVTLRRKVRNGSEGPEYVNHDVAWPAGWPLPTANDIVSGGPLAGWVEHVEYDTDAARVLIVLRP